MHKTAYVIGGLVMEAYCNLPTANVLEIGSYDVNGSLRDFALENTRYVGVDMEDGPGVDMVVGLGEDYPFDPDEFDLVMASSVFEHDPAFWVTFVRMCRVTKPGGHIYVNAPSNGLYHRYPLDHWRFYPDAGAALVAWARSQGQEVELVESFVVEHDGEVFNDFAAVFRKGPTDAPLPADFVYQKVACTNIFTHVSQDVISYREYTQDMVLIDQGRVLRDSLKEEIARKNAEVSALDADLESRQRLLDDLSDSLQEERRNSSATCEKLTEVAAQNAELLEAQIEREAELKRIRAENTQLEERQIEQIAELNRLQADKDKFADKIAMQESMLHQRSEEIDQAWSALDGMTKDRNNLSEKLQEENRRSEKRDEDLSVSEAWVFKLAATRQSLEKLTKQLRNQLKSSQSEAHSLKLDTQNLIDLNQRLTRENASLQAESKARMRTFEDQAEEFKNVATRAEARVAGLEQDLNTAETKLSSLELDLDRVSASLNDRYSELATLTGLLRQEEHTSRDQAELVDWLRQLIEILISMPQPLLFLSKQKRRQQLLSRLEKAGLFDGQGYLERNADVASQRHDPLLHYIHHGITEGRKAG